MYRVVGADNREYGPISAETVREWIAQGRANSETIVRLEEGGAWKPLRTFDEFREALGLPPNAVGGVPPISGFPASPKSNGFAAAGMVFGLLGCCCPFVAPILAIALSALALAQINARPADYITSPTIPKIGIVLGLVFLTIHLVLVFRNWT